MKLKLKRPPKRSGATPLADLATRAAKLARDTAPDCPADLQIVTRLRPTGHLSVRIERLTDEGAPITLRQMNITP